MKNLKSLFLTLILEALCCMALAQGYYNDSGNSGAGAAAAACSIILLVIVAWIVLNIALLIWVARDAKARGMDSAALWMILVWFTGLIGLIIYLFSRPQGIVVRCPHCRNSRLQVSAKCPHCGNP